MRQIVLACAAVLLISTALAQHTHHQTNQDQVMHTHHPTGEADGTPGVVTGYVRDVACLLRNPKGGAAVSPLTQDCLRKCVRGGSPIGILSEDGVLYTPVSDVIPDTSVRNAMLPYAGKYVRAKGRLFERGGLHAIAIEKIEIINRPADSKIPTL
jgi:hypothetical protein